MQCKYYEDPPVGGMRPLRSTKGFCLVEYGSTLMVITNSSSAFSQDTQKYHV